jgi:O-antigen/teichoic acid export membrane protein
MAVNNLLYLVICTSDLMIVQFVSPNKSDVGLYAVTLIIASAVLVIPQNLYAPLKTKVSHLVDSAEGKQKLVLELKRLNRFALFFICLVGIGILIFSQQLLHHFGTVYLQANHALIILTVGFMAAAYAPAASTLIAYSGNEKLLLDISLIELGLIILLGIVLTYFWGYTGTALATSLTFFSKTLIFHIETYRRLGIASFLL